MLPDPPGSARQAQHHISDGRGMRPRQREEPDSPVPAAPAIQLLHPAPRSLHVDSFPAPDIGLPEARPGGRGASASTRILMHGQHFLH